MNILEFKIKDDLDINQLVFENDPELFNFLNNKFLYSQSTKEWGKMASNAVEYVIEFMLNDYFGDDFCEVRGQVGNGEGYDILTINGDRIQCKLAGNYKGQTVFSKSLSGFETTRRNSQLNQNNNSTGHVSYRSNEFDYLIYTFVHNYNNSQSELESLRKDMNRWHYCLIKVSDITDPNNEANCLTSISKDILNRSLIKRQQLTLNV